MINSFVNQLLNHPHIVVCNCLQWMPFEEYAAQKKVQEMDLLKFMCEICKAKVDRGYPWFSQLPVSNFTEDGQKSYLYLNTQALRRH